MFGYTKYRIKQPAGYVTECNARSMLEAAEHVIRHYNLAEDAEVKVWIDKQENEKDAITFKAIRVNYMGAQMV